MTQEADVTLQNKIKGDLTIAMKEKDTQKKEAIRVILGEFARMEQKTLTDDEVVRVLRKLQKSEKEVISRQGGDGSAFLSVIESYLPTMASDDDIRAWIDANVDLSGYQNKMQAMGKIMSHFGSRADGNRVKKILQAL
ncbi:MAG: GatB/YqeY domain-containing protein [Desulfobacterales bacterium]|jgi:hypothetical protein